MIATFEARRPVRRVLLVNPPGKRLYLRDYFCSKTTKSNYLYHPIDLLALSGTLSARFEVAVLDAMAKRLRFEEAIEGARAFAPDGVVTLVASVSWPEDRAFVRALARATGARILGIGDVFRGDAAAVLRELPDLDGALLSFANADAVAFFEGRTDALESAAWRRNGSIESRPFRPARGTWRAPTPRHDLFPRRGYRFSFARRAPFATVLTDFGCPYPCTFCIMGTLGYATRPVGDVLEELRLVRSLGVREVFFLDQTFGVERERALEICRALEGDAWSWTAFTRPDRAEAPLLEAMRRAGCHTVILGVESPDESILEAYRKGYGRDEVREAFAAARAAGLRTVGTFLIGLPEHDAEGIRRTAAYARELGCDFASFNVAVPRFGTPFRAEALREGLADPSARSMDQAGAWAAMPTRKLSREEVEALKRESYRSFYLRPRYWIGRIAGLRTLHEARSQVVEGLALVARNV